MTPAKRESPTSTGAVTMRGRFLRDLAPAAVVQAVLLAGLLLAVWWTGSRGAGGHWSLWVLAGLNALVFAAGAVQVLAFSRHLGEPMGRLVAHAQRVERGDADDAMPVVSADELGQITKSLNEIARHLKQEGEERERIVANVRKINEDLQEKVRRRQAELKRSLEDIKANAEFTAEVSAALKVQEALDKVARHAAAISGSDACAILEIDLAKNAFRCKALHELPGQFEQKLQGPSLELRRGSIGLCHLCDAFGGGEQLRTHGFRRQQNICHCQPPEGRDAAGLGAELGFALHQTANGRALEFPDLQKAGQFPFRGPAVEAGFSAALSVPIGGGNVPRSLVLFRRKKDRFDERVVELLTTLANQSSVVFERARLFEETMEKSIELAAANRHKDEFLANMSHELRTPLNTIIAGSQLLLQRHPMFGDLTERQAGYVQDFNNAGEHLLALINDILDLAKIEAGKKELALGTFDLKALLGNAVTLVRAKAEAHGLKLGVELDDAVGEIQADERMVKQIVVNLLSNAVKFTPDGGQVTLRTAMRNGAVDVSVIDTGVGIAAKDLEVIFEAFKQVGDVYKKGEGTGLGLTLAKRFATLHGGTIRVQSQEGKGSAFTLTLPLQATVPAEEPPPPDAEPPEPDRVIVVVERAPPSEQRLSPHLGKGLLVQTATGADEALARARERAPVLVLADPLLPDHAGWKALAGLTADAASAEAAVMLGAVRDGTGRGFVLGASACLFKPLDPDRLLRAVQRARPVAGPRSVLAMDDQLPVLGFIERVLAADGLEVLTAPGGRQGINLARQRRPGVVIVDLAMPGTDGIDVSAALRNDPATATIPVILVVASADLDALESRITALVQQGKQGPSDLVSTAQMLLQQEDPA